MEAYLKPIHVILEENPNLYLRDDGTYLDRNSEVRINPDMSGLFERCSMKEVFTFRKCFSHRYDYQMNGYGNWFYCKEWLISTHEMLEPIEYPKEQKFDPMELVDV